MENHPALYQKHYERSQDLISDYLVNNNGSIFHRETLIYRGEASARFNLIPSVFRLNENQKRWFFNKSHLVDNECKFEHQLIEAERSALNNFYKAADNIGLPIPQVLKMQNEIAFSNLPEKGKPWIPDDLLELAGLAQHYGVPTRLLDWSFDFFVALYFASSNAMASLKAGSGQDDNIVLWALNYPLIEVLKYSSLESPLKLIKPNYFGNPNLAAQSGVFTLFQIPYNKPNLKVSVEDEINHLINRTPFDQLFLNEIDKCTNNFFQREVGNVKPALIKITLPVTESYNLFTTLINMKYDASRLFPGYSSIVKKFEQDSLLYVNDYNKIY